MSEPYIVPIELRKDFTARVRLPPDVTLAEARKVANVVLALAEPSDTPIPVHLIALAETGIPGLATREVEGE